MKRENNEKIKIEIQRLENDSKDESNKLQQYTPENLKQKVPVVKVIKRPIIRNYEEEVNVGYHSTYCNRCLYVCHDRCGLDVLGSGNINFKGCWAFGGNENCQQCTNRCGLAFHCHSSYQKKRITKTEYVDDTETVWEEIINPDKKKIKEQLEANARTIKENIKKQQETLNKLDIQLKSDLKQICFFTQKYTIYKYVSCK